MSRILLKHNSKPICSMQTYWLKPPFPTRGRCLEQKLLIFSRKLFVDPEKFLAFVHHTDKTAEAGIFGFEQNMEFTQSGILGTSSNAVWKINRIACISKDFSF